MARNQEKAQSMLNRWQQLKKDMEKGEFIPRPWNTQDCRSLSEAERWRKQVLKEVTRKISEIQNASLGEFRIRELNDEINKLLREKFRWEKRIIELGGVNYITRSRGDAQFEGREAQGSRGYKYFGSAKDLPGVRELFEKPVAGPQKRTRYEMHKGVTPDYYGYRDDDDGVLEKYEKKAEEKMREKVIEEFTSTAATAAELNATLSVEEHPSSSTSPLATSFTASASASTSTSTSTSGSKRSVGITTAEEEAGFSSLVSIPSQSQVASQMLQLKKKHLLSRLGLGQGLGLGQVVEENATSTHTTSSASIVKK